MNFLSFLSWRNGLIPKDFLIIMRHLRKWNSWGNLWESSAKLSSVIYPGGYQGRFSQVALFCNAKNVGEVTSCGVEFEDSSTPDVLNKFPNVYLLRPNNAGTNVTYDVYRMFIGQLK